MPEFITKPVIVEAAGNVPKIIEEFIGRASTGTPEVSIAHMKSPAGWEEPGQRPDFDEFTVVLSGRLIIEHSEGRTEVEAARPSTPGRASGCATAHHPRAAPTTSRCASRLSRPTPSAETTSCARPSSAAVGRR
jgi:hypothetical protein